MKIRLTSITALSLMLIGTGAWADDGEATIRLMGNAEAELPEAVTREITLPQHLLDASDESQSAAVENAEHGLETANENRGRSEQGRANAEEARERGAEMSEKAKEARENRGRSEDPPGRPDNPGRR